MTAPTASAIQLVVNGRERAIAVEPHHTLLDVLRATTSA